jgi:D-xylose 1-dehydrogenase (NADP+, D-xylono-1,5-lactone-forming)
VLGCANIALTKVLPAMQRAQSCEVMATTLGIARSYGSYEELLRDPDVESEARVCVLGQPVLRFHG